ncbi:protein GVQW3-like [Euwallacea similis]|uniref:protein GVQW3-like n=1 Tax=Euwallacea similis TaxID=1736056 RepID=UPI0034505E10
MAFVIKSPSKFDQLYEEALFAYPTVKEWCRKFRDGKEGTKDALRPDAVCTASTDTNIARVNDLIRENRRISIKAISQNIDVSVGSVRSIVQKLGCRKICAQRVPRLLSGNKKYLRISLSLQHLTEYNESGNNFLLSIVAGDET